MELEDADDESFSDKSSEPLQKTASDAPREQNKGVMNTDKEVAKTADEVSVSDSFESVSEDIQEEFEDDFEDDENNGNDSDEYRDKQDKDRSANNISGLSDPSFSFTNDVSASQESERSNESETMISRQTSTTSDYDVR